MPLTPEGYDRIDGMLPDGVQVERPFKMEDIALIINGHKVTGYATEDDFPNDKTWPCPMRITLPDDSPWVEMLGSAKMRCGGYWGHEGQHQFGNAGYTLRFGITPS